MNEMWQVVKGAGILTTGINHWVYLPDGRLFVGVELRSPQRLPTPDQLEPLEFELPRYMKHLHIGPYQALPQKWKELKADLAARGEVIGSPSLEIYGHHCDEPSKSETTILIGLQQLLHPMSELIAYHEAGHALMAVLLGGKVKQVTIEPDDDDGPDRQGDTQVLWRRSGISDDEFAKIAVQVSLAGPVAEMIYSGDPYHPGLVAEWAADWREAWEAATPLHPAERQRFEYLEQISIQLYHRLKQGDLWAPLASLADNLLAHETLDCEQVDEIVEDWLG